MRQHHVVKAHATGDKALGLGIILAVDVAHQLRHDVLMIPRRAEGVLGHHPAFAEQHKIDIGGSRLARGRRQHGKDRRVRVVKQDRAHRAIGAQIVFIGRVVAVPCHHIQRALADLGLMELATPFHGQRRGHFTVLIGGHRCLEIPRVGHAVCTDRTTAGQIEFLTVVFADKAARRAIQHFDTVHQTTREDGDLLGLDVDDTEFGGKAQAAFLRDHQKLRVGGEEIFILHRLGHKIDMGCHADLGVHIPRRRHGAHPREPGQPLIRMRHRVPAVLAERNHILWNMRRALPVRQVDFLVAVRVLHAGADAIAPGALGAFRRKGGAGKLFAIEPIFAFLRAVHALGQGAGQGFGFKIIPKSGHVTLMGALIGRGLNHLVRQSVTGHFSQPPLAFPSR